MRSKTVSLRFPIVLLEAGALLSKEQYNNFNELVVGLLRYALAIHKPHAFTAAIAKLSLAEQDVIDDMIVKMFREGKSQKGSWFEHLVEQATQNVAAGKDVPADRLVKELVRLLSEKNEPPKKKKKAQ